MEDYKVIINDTDEEIDEEELRRLIDEALNKTTTIQEIIAVKEQELQETKEMYSELKTDFRKTKSILKKLIIRLRVSSVILTYYTGTAMLMGLSNSKEDFINIKKYIKENVKGIKEDLKLIDSLEKAFRSLTKYNIADKLEEIAEILIHLVNKTTLREKSTAKKMYELSSKLKGFNMIPSTFEERQIEETDDEIKKLTMELGL
mgnify:FL=1